MRRERHWSSVVAVAVLVLLVLAGTSSAAPGPVRLTPGLEGALEAASASELIAIVVVLRSDDLPPGPSAARRALVRRRQVRVLDALPAASFRLRRQYESVAGLAGWAVPAAIEALARHPEVELVYLDGRVHATLLQGVSLVGAASAHAQGLTGTGVTVAVLDSGIDTDHPDLSDDLLAEQCFCDNHPSPNFACCPAGSATQSGPGAAEDDAGHGTGVSGIVTSGGVVAKLGVAPDAEIAAIKVLSSSGGGDFSDVAAGLDWVLTNHASLGIRVVNMSLGGSIEYNDPLAFPCSGSVTANAIRDLHLAGIAVFVSSGNDGWGNGIAFPACVPEAISVGGVYDAAFTNVSWCGQTCATILCTDTNTSPDTFVCHSNSDEILDLLAPNWRTHTSALGGGKVAFGGTSASCPYAAGQAAILFEADATLTPDEIRSLLVTHGPQVTNPDNELSFTRSDVAAALASLATCGDTVLEVGEDCDDGNTTDGDCCSATCSWEPAGSACDDQDACTTSDTCDGSGTCDSGSPLVCDDVNVCTNDTCDSGSGCVFTPNLDPCDDGSACTTADACAGGSCVGGPPVVCDDTNICTDDSCDSGSGCVFTPNLDPCDDGSACTTADACAGGICQGGSPPACNDANVCTDDGCDPGSGCTFTPNTDPCDDGNACTTADTCSGSVCQAGPPLVCDDANACTQDSCDTLLGCVVEGPQICPVPATSAWGRVLLAVSLLAGALTVRRR